MGRFYMTMRTSLSDAVTIRPRPSPHPRSSQNGTKKPKKRLCSYLLVTRHLSLATDFLIATHPSSEIDTTHSQQTGSQILIATVNAFSNSPPALPGANRGRERRRGISSGRRRRIGAVFEGRGGWRRLGRT